MLVAVICCYLSELEDLLFLLHLICASYEYELYMCFDVCHAIFREVYAMFFVISLVTSTSMQTRLRDVSDFRDLVILPSDCCYFVAMYPCVYREIHAPFGDVQ